MRGSALIFHSLDPETLDKIDDLASLDSLDFDDETETDDRYSTLSESPSQQAWSPSPPPHYETGNLALNESLSKSSHIVVPGGVNNTLNCGIVVPKAKSETTNHAQRRRSNNCGANNAAPTTSASFPILDQLVAISSSPLSSSPLNKSNYSKVDGKQGARSQEQSSKSQNFIPDHNPSHQHHCNPEHRVSSNRRNNSADINEAVTQGRRISTSSSSSQCQLVKIKENKTFTSNYTAGGGGAGLPLSRIKASRLGRSSSTNSISTSQSPRSIGSTGENQNSRGFARFLFGLDFSKNKEDKSKLDVYNLPPQLKAELKRIYVY
ncbi:uncharacterized protein LOC110856179 [Folsomia candida]|uniref:Uncharacterized protein n=1 Tax=Folsomia candida TaxID=158441 RepID=A0A226DN30_FOLCA|nr:uncharacterized protein LOC110856179 [Folsomia candida]OXA46418.1 hypothetical protein Fcan01_18590 [Folsomia candida]